VIHLGQQRGDQVDLAADLRPAEHGDERALRPAERLAEVLELLLHEEPGDGRLEHPGHGLGARVGPMGRAEGIVHVEVAQRGEPRRQLGVVALFTREEPRVLRDGHAAPRQPPGVGDRLLGERVAEERHRRPEQTLDLPHHGFHRILRVRFALGPAEV
jgi:hypothetical protein